MFVFNIFILLLSATSVLSTFDDDFSKFLGACFTIEPRIKGGYVAAEETHMVALSFGKIVRSYYCGGSLISRRTILTAAHCIDPVYDSGSLSKSLRATVGTNQRESGGTSYSISRNVTHPHFVPTTLTNDIGLLITTRRVELSDLVQPIALNFDEVGRGVPVIVMGWGDDTTEDLMAVKMCTISGPDCEKAIKIYNVVAKTRMRVAEPDTELCTMPAIGDGTCMGDSGGPLISDGMQIGVVSRGMPCARGAPDVYARISAYEEFITSNVVGELID